MRSVRLGIVVLAVLVLPPPVAAVTRRGRFRRRWHHRAIGRERQPGRNLSRHHRGPDRLGPGVGVRGLLPHARPQPGRGHRAQAGDRAAGLRSKDTGVKLEVRLGGPSIGFEPVSSRCTRTPAHHPRPGQHRRGDPLLGQAGDPGCGRPHGDQPVHDHVGPAGLPAVQHHRRHRQDRHQGPLLRGRHLHGVPDRDQCAEEGPGRRVLRRQAGQLRGRRRQGRPGRLRHLRALHLRERGPAVEQAGEVRAGERGRLPVLPQALSIRAADKQAGPCLEKLVPIVQRAQVDFLAMPRPTS